MPTRLKDLKITKVDFVDAGANPNAYIVITKKADVNPKPSEVEEPSFGVFKSFFEKFMSFMKDGGLGISGTEPNKTNRKEIGKNGGKYEMKFNTESMTPEDAAAFENLRKKYEVVGKAGNNIDDGGKSEDDKDGNNKKTDAKKSDVPPENNSNPIDKRDAELDALKKRVEYFEDREMLEVAKKYEALGKKPEDLAKSLKAYKNAGGTLYDDMIATLDVALDAVNKSSAFEEVGKKGIGNSGSVSVSKIEKFAQEIMAKDPSLDRYQAIDKAYMDHPELIEEE